MCIYNESAGQKKGLIDRAKVGESQHWLVLYPCLGNIRPIAAAAEAAGERSEEAAATSHLQLVPKEHFASSLELDEDVGRDL